MDGGKGGNGEDAVGNIVKARYRYLGRYADSMLLQCPDGTESHLVIGSNDCIEVPVSFDQSDCCLICPLFQKICIEYYRFSLGKEFGQRM